MRSRGFMPLYGQMTAYARGKVVDLLFRDTHTPKHKKVRGKGTPDQPRHPAGLGAPHTKNFG